MDDAEIGLNRLMKKYFFLSLLLSEANCRRGRRRWRRYGTGMMEEVADPKGTRPDRARRNHGDLLRPYEGSRRKKMPRGKQAKSFLSPPYLLTTLRCVRSVRPSVRRPSGEANRAGFALLCALARSFSKDSRKSEVWEEVSSKVCRALGSRLSLSRTARQTDSIRTNTHRESFSTLSGRQHGLSASVLRKQIFSWTNQSAGKAMRGRRLILWFPD